MYKIRTKNFICFFVTISTIVIVTCTFVYLRAKNEVLSAAHENLKIEFNNQQEEINETFAKIKRAGDYLNYNRYVYELITTPSENAVEYNQNVNYLKSEYQNAYDMLLREENALIYTNVLFLDDKLPISEKMLPTALTADTKSNIFTNGYIKAENWYNDILSADNDIFFFRENIDQNILYVAHIMRSQFDVDHVLGVSIVKINLKNMELKLSKSTNGRTMLITDSRLISDEIGNGGTVERIKKDNVYYFMSSLHIYNNIKIVSLIPEETALKGVYQMRKIILLFCTCVFLIGLCVSFWCSEILTRPVLKLVRIMQNSDVLYCGDFDTLITTRDEIGKLYEAFGGMLKRIRKLVSEKQILSEKKIEAEIKALQAQINPHFICNVLNSVSVQALSRNEDDISRVLRLLAQLLRYNINDMSRLVPITEEIEFIKTYMNIQRSVYGQGLKLDVFISKETKSLKIMRCMVQPLIENAVIHGIDDGEHRINIQIQVYTKEGKLLIEVDDDGIGCDAYKLNEALENDVLLHSNSIGCININRRISLRFGVEYRLCYKVKDKGTKAVLIFPIIDEGQGGGI